MTTQSRKNQQAIFNKIDRLRQENIRIRRALRDYANIDYWTFYHDKDGHIRWVTKLGPDLAMEALTPVEPGTLVIKKEKTS